MPDPAPPSPSPPAAPRHRSHFNNWISAIGGVIALGALFSFALLVWMDFTQGEKNPYLGIFTYLVAPAFLLSGLALALFGAWAQRRWAIRHASAPDRWRLDFHSPAQRRGLAALAAGALGFVILSFCRRFIRDKSKRCVGFHSQFDRPHAPLALHGQINLGFQVHPNLRIATRNKHQLTLEHP